MITVKTVIASTPLLVRVVCLYVLVAIPMWAVGHVSQPAPVAAIQVPVVYKAVSKQVIEGTPSQLKIPRIGIDLPIVAGRYDAAKDTWTLRDDAVQYATVSTLPNDETGNTFIYGHNTTAVLEPVKDLRPGDLLTITTTNGLVFTYAYTKDALAKPNETDVITDDSKTPRVTLMTCEGIFSLTRRLMYFDFKGVA